VTGRGVVTGLGPDLATTWDRLLTGHSAARPIAGVDAPNSNVAHAAQVDDDALAGWLPKVRARRLMDRRGLLAFAAAHQALHEAGLGGSDITLGDRVGVALATGHVLADVNELIAAITQMEDVGSAEWSAAEIVSVGRRVPPLSLVTRINNMPASHVAMTAGCRGPSVTVTGDCGGAHALGSASRWIRSGVADMMLAGGVDSRIDPLHLALLRSNDSEENGFPSEGAAFLVLESLPHAIARGARVFAELVGHGCTHSADASPDQLARTFDRAASLAMGGSESESVDVVFAAAANGTQLGEAAFVDRRWTNAAVTTPNSHLGETRAAALMIHSALATEALRRGLAPQSFAATHSEPAGRRCPPAPGAARRGSFQRAAVCGASEDGQAAVIVWRKSDGPA
jgi:3-oxoacyl-[acyl-carrier-protein] synthase II